MNDISNNTIAALPHLHSGAARVSIFFALWSLALVMLHDVRVNAAPVYEIQSSVADSRWWTPPAPPPAIAPLTMWNGIAEYSHVIDGTWQAADEVTLSRRTPHGATPHETQRSKPKAPVVMADPELNQRRVDAPSRSADEPAPIRTASSMVAAQVQVARHIEAGDFVGAIDAIARTRVEMPEAAAQLRLLEARVAILQNDPERAYHLLLDGLPDIREATAHYDLLAAMMLRTSRFAESAKVYRALLAVDQGNARWWAGYAVSQERLGDRAELAVAYRALRALAVPGSALATWATQRLERYG
jgi:hypothetical protein